MKSIVIIILVAIAFINNGHCQKHITKAGVIEIFSETPLFTIEAINKNVASILNIENGEVVASTLVRSFDFEEALVEEHFNENYMESHDYPKATFKGVIDDFTSIDLNKDALYNLTITGDLTIHGTSVKIKEPVKIGVKNKKISGNTDFVVSLKAHKIKIEDLYKNRIKDEIELKVHFNYEPYNK